MALKEKTKSKEKVKEEKKGKGKNGAGTSGTSYAGVSHAVGGTQTGDLMPYQQQVSAMMSEMEDYIEASNGLPDPTALNQMQTNIVRLQAAIGDLPGPTTAEDLRADLQQGLVPLVESRIGQVGVSAFRAMAADYSQIYATGMQVYDKIDSTDGYIEQLLVSIAQYKQQRDSYLEAGLSQNHAVIVIPHYRLSG